MLLLIKVQSGREKELKPSDIIIGPSQTASAHLAAELRGIQKNKHPKWMIVLKILEINGSLHARKIAVRLKKYDVDNFLLAIKIIILSNLF
ncbi:Uncharacterised protein [uncultured archaeon]|nr:Uncharacterised protein [uncultured archaeon]